MFDCGKLGLGYGNFDLFFLFFFFGCDFSAREMNGNWR